MYLERLSKEAQSSNLQAICHLGLDYLKALVLPPMMFPEQDPTAGHHASMFPASTLDVQHQVVANTPGVMIVFILTSSAFKSGWKLLEIIVFFCDQCKSDYL